MPKPTQTRSLLWVCLASTVLGCGSGVPAGHYTYREPSAAAQPPERHAAPSTGAIEPALVTGLNDFGLRALHEAQGPNDIAVTLSPASISLALAMAFEGARGETREEMRRTLQLRGDDDTVRETLASLLTRLDDNRRGDRSAPLGFFVGNRLFVEQSLPIRAEFRALMTDVYDAPTESLDFARAAEPSRVRINAWVQSSTRDRIVDLIPQGGINASTRLVLTNAVYFKGAWGSAFDPVATQERPFHRLNDSTASVPMMRDTSRYMFVANASVQAISLPYADRRFAMLVAIPQVRTDEAFRAWLGTQTAASIAQLVASLVPQSVDVMLPKWTTHTDSIALGDVLRRMGMQRVFSDASDLTGISDAPLHLSEVFHKVFVDVTEAGTEAAAASAAIIQLTSAIEPPDSVSFVADRPFVYFLRDVESGLILFAGVYNGPTA